MCLCTVSCQKKRCLQWSKNAFPCILFPGCSAAARFQTDPQGSGHGVPADVQGQRTQPQTSTGRQRHGGGRGGGQKRQKRGNGECLISAHSVKVLDSLTLIECPNFKTSHLENNLNTQLQCAHINIIDCMCYMSALESRVMCWRKTAVWASVLHCPLP